MNCSKRKFIVLKVLQKLVWGPVFSLMILMIHKPLSQSGVSSVVQPSMSVKPRFMTSFKMSEFWEEKIEGLHCTFPEILQCPHIRAGSFRLRQGLKGPEEGPKIRKCLKFS